MNYRRLSQAAEWAVAITVVALHVLILVLARQHADVAWLQLAGDAQPIVVAALALGWGLFGPGWLWVRAVAVPILAIGWVLVVQQTDRRFFNPAGSDLPFPFAVAIAVGLVFGVLRLAGLRMQGIPAGEEEPRPQFSILALLATTTLIALVIGGLELLRPTVISAARDLPYDELVKSIIQVERDATWGRLEVARGLIPGPASVRQGVLALAIAGAAAGGLALVLRPRTIWLRLAMAAIALPMLGVYLTHLANTGRDVFATRATELSLAFAAVTVLVAVSALPLRLMGYRLLCGEREVLASRCARAGETLPAKVPGCSSTPLASSEVPI